MIPGNIVIGSRASKLAMVQARYIGDLISRYFPGIKVEIKPIKTTGDKILDAALSRIGGKGLFTKEIEDELLSGGIDLAVHSLKDLPTELPEGLAIGAVPKREDPRDVLVSDKASTIGALPKGAKVGTSSLRRKAQLLNLREDLTVLDLRGNVETRVAKLKSGAYDAIILASAGIKRLGLDLERSEISVEEILPQAGQGALGIEIRSDAFSVRDLVIVLDDADSRLAVTAERALLNGLEGGCQVPVGVYAGIAGDRIDIRAGIFSLDGRDSEKAGIEGPKKEARELGEALARKILEIGSARRLLDEFKKMRFDKG
ncbi:MAG: hydroxymethylbilane synthase [Candidatus Omnitrophica bacterium]|nr:hydroxymethylbilane synthase [Candidatus Omnitrophota bacterium]